MPGAAAAIALVAAAVIAWLVGAPLLAAHRRRLAMARPLPAATIAHIERNVPQRRRLPPALAARHEALASAFLAEKEFVGCGGLVVDEEMRATIAALACLLLLGRRGHYEGLRSVLVYPSGFWVEDEVADEAGVVARRRRDLAGEAWDSSRIILSWEDVLEAARFPGAGYNVALHEFAHFLDAEGLGLATPPGAARTAATLESWSAGLRSEFELLQQAVADGEDTFLDPYAAEDESEFFAVASEDFFERPQEFRDRHARLYGLVQQFYGLDPAAW